MQKSLPPQRHSDFIYRPSISRSTNGLSREQIHAICDTGESVLIEGKQYLNRTQLPKYDVDTVVHEILPSDVIKVTQGDIDVGAVPKLALLLKGGGVRGLALVGALQEMKKYYSYSAFVGTSAGAIVAGLLAAECTPDDLEKILRQTDFRKFQDARWYQRIKNLVLHFYLYPGRAFEEWLWQQVQTFNKNNWKVQPPKLKDLKEAPNHLCGAGGRWSTHFRFGQ